MIQKFLRATAVSATVTVLEFTYHTVDAVHVPLLYSQCNGHCAKNKISWDSVIQLIGHYKPAKANIYIYTRV